MFQLTFTPDNGLSGPHGSTHSARTAVIEAANRDHLTATGHDAGYLVNGVGKPIFHFRISPFAIQNWEEL